MEQYPPYTASRTPDWGWVLSSEVVEMQSVNRDVPDDNEMAVPSSSSPSHLTINHARRVTILSYQLFDGSTVYRHGQLINVSIR